jgi:P-type E1-E2 ATPase
MYEPLAVIVLVSALRAAGEDINKHRADSSRNGAPYLTLQSDGKFKPVRSGDIKVGSIIKITQNMMIPADILFLGSALPKGHCFIDKANLNGETTLEVMSSIPQTRHWFKTDDSAKEFACSLDYEPPNKRFDSFRGMMSHYHCKRSIPE